MSVKPVLFNNTVLRDGHQSMAATRMTTAQMLPAAPVLDGMGFTGLETWGGATIDSCLRFLNENPFDRLRTLKRVAPKTPQIMLLRGQNIVQYASFPDDVVEAFVRCMCQNGMDIFRIFDALNDVRNLQDRHQGRQEVTANTPAASCATPSARSTRWRISSSWASNSRRWAAIRSASRTCRASSSPQVAYRSGQGTQAPRWHPHHAAHPRHRRPGRRQLSGRHRRRRGLRRSLDRALRQRHLAAGHAAHAGAARRPPPLPEVRHAKSSPSCAIYFEGVYKELAKFTSPANERVDSDILIYQVPGGMLSNFRTQLKEQGMAEQVRRGVQRNPRRARGARLDSAGHADLADRRHPGDDERQVRPLENDLPAGAGHRPRQIRPHARAHRRPTCSPRSRS